LSHSHEQPIVAVIHVAHESDEPGRNDARPEKGAATDRRDSGRPVRNRRPLRGEVQGDFTASQEVALTAKERRTEQVFGSVESPKRLAGAIRDFAQGLADRYARPGGTLVVSVSIKTRK
jgi:hypothetical protein